ncbi:Iron-responsive element-binding protein 2 [Tupaia chinensis]|uniref:Iron-responsive element-binding protein 2 n=1 Tax=Tupaia chinensis TaxID=246437 RepID=L9LAB0_TUPCH|nr:Iron-responsive element-binding protein 2 [Tupaia chinensis]
MAHQVNLEHLSRVVFEDKDLLFPDSVVGTDSHITMVNGLGILGWGVGGIETEAVMLGLPVSFTLPEVVGCELTGSSNPFATSIDVVLGITKHLRQVGVAGKFVEFFGSGVSQLSIVDRTTIANMCPEYGAVLSFFPVDNVTLKHLEHTGFDRAKLESVETYLKAVKLFRDDQSSSGHPEYSQVIQINLNSIVPSVSGPKRPQDRVAVADMKSDFQACLNEKVGFKGFQIAAEKQSDTVSIHYEGSEYKLSHGSVVIAAVISCTNNCNPSVMLAAGLLAKKAVEAGLRVKPYIRTSLSPGSGMVTHYLSSSGVLPFLSKLGFEIVGYGCSTCVGNTAPLSEAVLNAVKQGDLVTCGVLSGNKNFEGRLCDCVRANYLASPPLVVAYAIAGTVNIDFQTEPLGIDPTGKDVYLQDIWPSREEVHRVEEEHVILSMFKALKEKIELDVFEAAELYQKEGIPLIILAGKKYGSGNSRDWAAKGPYLLTPCEREGKSLSPLVPTCDPEVLAEIRNESVPPEKPFGLTSETCVQTRRAKEVDPSTVALATLPSAESPPEYLAAGERIHPRTSGRCADSGSGVKSHLVRLLTYLPGRPVAEIPFSAQLLYNIGRLAASLDKTLEKFHHPKLSCLQREDFIWNLKNVPLLEKYLYTLGQNRNREIVEQVIQLFKEEVMTKLSHFRECINHGDLNDHNLLVESSESASGGSEYQISGILDFGDMSYGYYVFEVAITIMYMMIESSTPVQVGGHVLAGFESVIPLTAVERGALFLLVCGRFCQSLVMATYSCQLHPENTEYLMITAKTGWKHLQLMFDMGQKAVEEIWFETAKSYASGTSM